ncbi:MAG: RNA-protein complex protein Nop10 [Candidatus Bathyarchaeota archaeon]|nr:RNA-protein complex protein Nop10 [Candidatus Bathyarchaeota archaeon]
MVWLMMRCIVCKRYTLNRDRCPSCGGAVKSAHPAKFSPDDRYAKYKGMMRRMSREENSNSGEREG